MNNATNHPQIPEIITKFTFFCHYCDSAPNVFVENWVKNNEGPYEIELLHHKGTTAIIVGKININKKPEGESVKFKYCTDCGQMIQPPLDQDYKTIMECYNPFITKN